MSQSLVAIIVGLAAAAGGVLLMDSLRTAPVGSAAGPTDLSAIETRLLEIEKRLPAMGTDGVLLSTSGGDREILTRLARIEEALQQGGAGGLAAAGAEGGAQSPLRRIDERLASIEEKLGGEDGERPGSRRAPKKRVSLAEASLALDLSGAQEDELRQIYDRFHEKMYKLAAGPDGDPEEVKREVAAAAKDPTKAMGLVGKYMPNVIGNIGGMMQAQTEREQAIQKLLGPEKATRLQREFDVKEDNILGLGGARTEFRVDSR